MSMGCFIAMATLPAAELCVEAVEAVESAAAADAIRSAGRNVVHVATM